MGDPVSFPDVWNAVKDVASLCKNNVHVGMGNRAFVAPHGKEPMDLNWDNQIDRSLQLVFRNDTYASQYTDGLFSPLIYRVGLEWKCGGTVDGHGLFLHEAALFCVVDSTALGSCVDATGSFSDKPYMMKGVAQLEGTIEVSITELGGALHVESLRFKVLAAGDGSGYLRRV
jgi:hypothetical protein